VSRLCACQARLNAEGKCPHGCEKFRKPHQTLERIQVAARRAAAKETQGLGVSNGLESHKLPWRRRKRA
jgi:hypothetical protein